MDVVRPEVCVGAVVVDEHDRLLLVQRGRGLAIGAWSVPGGRVESGETLEAATLRELSEETGIAGEVLRFLGWVERLGPEHHFVILDFLVRPLGTDVRPGDDADAVAWVPLAEMPTRPGTVPGLVEFLQQQGILPVSDPSTGEDASR